MGRNAGERVEEDEKELRKILKRGGEEGAPNLTRPSSPASRSGAGRDDPKASPHICSASRTAEPDSEEAEMMGCRPRCERRQSRTALEGEDDVEREGIEVSGSARLQRRSRCPTLPLPRRRLLGETPGSAHLLLLPVLPLSLLLPRVAIDVAR
jgi:hypothetical protein